MEIGSTADVRVLSAVQEFLDGLPTLPQQGTPEWDRLRQLDIEMHMGSASDETRESYREAWKLKYMADLKSNLPVVINEVLKPDFLAVDETGKLQEMVRNSNAAAIAISNELFLHALKAEYSAVLNNLRSVNFSEYVELKKKQKDLGEKWDAGLKVQSALRNLFGLGTTALINQYPTLSDLATNAPTLSQAEAQPIRIPGME